MKVVTLLAQKGGTGKTTLAVHWAVEAKGSVALVDYDPQRSAAGWGDIRLDDDLTAPRIIPPESVADAGLAATLGACRAAGVDIAIIDTAPHAEETAFAAARAADLVVIPTRPSAFDLRAIGATVDIVTTTGAKAVIVLNACPARGAVVDEARQALKAYKLPICPTPVVQRVALANAVIGGQAVREFEPRGKAAEEIAATWRWINRRLGA